MQPPAQKASGRVYLIGVSPRDPQLSTVRANECLALADLILCDGSLDRRITKSKSPSAEVIWLNSVVSEGPAEQWPLQEIVTRLVCSARAGKVAVHLKDGDPRLFSYDTEELRTLREAAVTVEIVPSATATTDFIAQAPDVGRDTPRPLLGNQILLTRPGDQSADLLARLQELGAEVTVQPAIQIAPPATWQPVDEAIAHLDRYDWLVFSSVNGVQYLLERIRAVGGDVQRLAGIKLAVIGPATAERLQRYHLNVAAIPPEFRAESLADMLAEQAAGKRFLLARASRGREILAERLQAAGGKVDQVVVYTSRDVEHPAPGIALAILAGQFDWVTVTSSAIARSLHTMFDQALECTQLASISPITSNTLRELGHEPAVEAKEYTTNGLVKAILDKCQLLP